MDGHFISTPGKLDEVNPKRELLDYFYYLQLYKCLYILYDASTFYNENDNYEINFSLNFSLSCRLVLDVP